METSLDIDGAATASVTFSVDELPEGHSRGYVGLDPDHDDLAFDDRRDSALPVAPPAPVLLVDGDPGRTRVESETFFLQTALRLAAPGETYEKAPFVVTTIESSGGSILPDLTKIRAVVLANLGDLSQADAKRLGSFVDQGGGLLVFTGDRVGAEVANTLKRQGWVSAMFWERRLLNRRGFRFDSNAGRRIIRFFARSKIRARRPSPAFVHRDHADQGRPEGPSPGLVSWQRTRGFERSHGHGKVVWFLSACDRAWAIGIAGGSTSR